MSKDREEILPRVKDLVMLVQTPYLKIMYYLA